MKNKLCPSCVGSTQVMIPKTNNKKGFEYQTCTLCNGSGVVSEEIEEDYLLSINEDLIDDYEWFNIKLYIISKFYYSYDCN